MNIVTELKLLNEKVISCTKCDNKLNQPFDVEKNGEIKTFEAGIRHGGYTTAFDKPSILKKHRISIIIFGQNPGYQAQEHGEIIPFDFNMENPPFKAGKYIQAALREYNIPKETVYVSNIVKCSTEENHYPKDEQLINCRKWFEEELRIIRPELVICLGKPACWRFGILPGESKKLRNFYVLGSHHPSQVGLRKTDFIAGLSELGEQEKWKE